MLQLTAKEIRARLENPTALSCDAVRIARCFLRRQDGGRRRRCPRGFFLHYEGGGLWGAYGWQWSGSCFFPGECSIGPTATCVSDAWTTYDTDQAAASAALVEVGVTDALVKSATTALNRLIRRRTGLG